MLKKLSLLLLVILYVGAGVNHFIHPEFYASIMPPYIPAPLFMVELSGVAEFALGILLIPVSTRKWAAWLIAIMLIVFISVHVFMLQQAYTVENYNISVRAAWTRLLLQPFLIFWVLWQGRGAGNKVRK